jgi:hypothetical protein
MPTDYERDKIEEIGTRYKQTAERAQASLTWMLVLCIASFLVAWGGLRVLEATDMEFLCAFIAVSTVFLVGAVGWIMLALASLLPGINLTILGVGIDLKEAIKKAT